LTGKPENVDEWGNDEESKERDSDGIPEEEESDDVYESNPVNPGEILRPGELGEGDSIRGKSETDIENEWETAVKRAQAGGKIPVGISRGLNKLKEAVIDWKSELSEFIDDAVARTKYKLPNRRFIGSGDAQYGYKRYREDFNNLVIAIDTSGSISKSMITQFLSETMKITEEYSPQETVIIYCSDDIDNVDRFEKGGQPDLTKIATTNGNRLGFSPPFKWVEENILEEGETPAVFIYFTDGEASFPKSSDYDIESYQDRCIWVFLSFNGDPYRNSQPFGSRIDITLANNKVKTI
jgi:predicted metal-dependent peptidase